MSTTDPLARFAGVHRRVAEYYAGKLLTFGATPQGVDWNSAESQALRFDQLSHLFDLGRPFSLNDYGCGYGALAEYLLARGAHVDYRGLDLAPEMLVQARQRLEGRLTSQFFAEAAALPPAEYTVASGIFNVKLSMPDQEWTDYMLQTLRHMNSVSERGIAFNVLTLYSDPEKRRPDLYYADPLMVFDYCRQKLSRHTALLHDYPLYEFTILVRK